MVASKQAEKICYVWDIAFEKRSLGGGYFWLFALGVESGVTFDGGEIQKLAREEGVLLVQVESIFYNDGFEMQADGFEKGYFKKFITPYTAILDLQKDLDVLLSEMKPKGRYNINLAEKKWVVAFEAEKTDENIKIFYDLMLETTTRDHFSGNTLEYYKHFLRMIPESSLIFTKYEEVVLSAGIFIFGQEVSLYYYGASTSDKTYRNLMAPYLMQWFAIERAKAKGSKYYDFLWVASPGDDDSPLAWVTDFKLKFTKVATYCSESMLYIPSFWKYRCFVFGKKIYGIIKKIKG